MDSKQWSSVNNHRHTGSTALFWPLAPDPGPLVPAPGPNSQPWRRSRDDQVKDSVRRL